MPINLVVIINEEDLALKTYTENTAVKEKKDEIEELTVCIKCGDVYFGAKEANTASGWVCEWCK